MQREDSGGRRCPELSSLLTTFDHSLVIPACVITPHLVAYAVKPKLATVCCNTHSPKAFLHGVSEAHLRMSRDSRPLFRVTRERCQNFVVVVKMDGARPSYRTGLWTRLWDFSRQNISEVADLQRDLDWDPDELGRHAESLFHVVIFTLPVLTPVVPPPLILGRCKFSILTRHSYASPGNYRKQPWYPLREKSAYPDEIPHARCRTSIYFHGEFSSTAATFSGNCASPRAAPKYLFAPCMLPSASVRDR